MRIGLRPATIRRHLGHNSRIGLAAMQTPTVTRGGSEDSQRQPKGRATAGAGSRQVWAVAHQNPGSDLEGRGGFSPFLRRQERCWFRGHRMASGNGLPFERPAGLGRPSNESPASEIRPSDQIHNGSGELRNGLCSEVLQLCRGRLCRCLREARTCEDGAGNENTRSRKDR